MYLVAIYYIIIYNNISKYIIFNDMQFLVQKVYLDEKFEAFLAFLSLGSYSKVSNKS